VSWFEFVKRHKDRTSHLTAPAHYDSCTPE